MPDLPVEIHGFRSTPNYKEINVASQENDPDSLLSFYKELIALRKNPEYKETIVYGELIPYLEEQHNLMSYYRKGDKTLLVLGNFQKEPQTVKLPSACRQSSAQQLSSAEHQRRLCNS